MPYCSACRRSELAGSWSFCPRCGHPLSAETPPADRGPVDPKQLLINIALDAAQRFVEGRVQQKLAPVAQTITQLFGPAAAPGAAVTPDWYGAAVNAQQPTASATELAMIQAEEITNTQTAVHMAEAAMASARARNSVLTAKW
jgi:hypothetical protein